MPYLQSSHVFPMFDCSVLNIKKFMWFRQTVFDLCPFRANRRNWPLTSCHQETHIFYNFLEIFRLKQKNQDISKKNLTDHENDKVTFWEMGVVKVLRSSFLQFWHPKISLKQKNYF